MKQVSHVSESYVGQKFWCEREFVPKSDTFGLIKEKYGYEHDL